MWVHQATRNLHSPKRQKVSPLIQLDCATFYETVHRTGQQLEQEILEAVEEVLRERMKAN